MFASFPLRFLLSIALFLASALCDLDLFYGSEEYDRGDYSTFPVQEYVTSAFISVPRFNVLALDESCASDGLYVFIAPRGMIPVQSGPMIVDSLGHLIWTDPAFPNAYNFRVQKYRGEDVLTFWVGDDMVRGHGSGEYIMLDSRYREIRRFNAGNGFAGDLHEFLITEQDTALVTIYQVYEADMTSVGREEKPSFIWDSLFQEIDMESGEVLFQWRASDWFDLTDSYYGIRDYGEEDNAWDYFHINSIDKDPLGNYLISARYTHSAIYIDHKTGEPLWHLGGKNNSFADLSGGKATIFAGQHDARWHDDYTVISMFDNGADYDTQTADYSRAVKIRINTDNMTAELEQELINPQRILSASQGSSQIMENGNTLVGYGFNGAWTEFNANGDVLCNFQYESASAFGTGDAQSYRTFKFPWKADPTVPPDIVLRGDDLGAYMSWNGATEIDKWVLMHSNSPSSDYEEMDRTERQGFESVIFLDKDDLKQYVKAVAIDAQGKVLGETRVVEAWSIFNMYNGYVVSNVIGGFIIVTSAGFTACLLRFTNWASFFSRWRYSRLPTHTGL